MATENGWSLKTTPSVFETKLLKVSEVKQVTPYYTGANNSSGLYIKSFYSNEQAQHNRSKEGHCSLLANKHMPSLYSK